MSAHPASLLDVIAVARCKVVRQGPAVDGLRSTWR